MDDDDKLLLQMSKVFGRKYKERVEAFVNSILSEVGENAAMQCAALGGISGAMADLISEKLDGASIEIDTKLGIDPKKSKN